VKTALITRSSDILFSEMPEGTVLMSIEKGSYYGLDEVGARVWSLLEEPRNAKSLRDRLLAEYEVDSETCARELNDLLEKLNAQGLIIFEAGGNPER